MSARVASKKKLNKKKIAAVPTLQKKKRKLSNNRPSLTLAEELLGAEAVHLVHDDGAVHLGALRHLQRENARVCNEKVRRRTIEKHF